ncbi:MAG TPA: TIR domain-containing protein [Sphingomicrobium sp.]|nr:TIR domain-containing protein [Sphingomicrobium sp.]
MAKLFLSYSRKNETRARRLTAWLENAGHDVWRDEEDIGGGASFSSEIEKALKECDAVLVLWSVESVQSAWVRDEAGWGRDAGKLIPFSLDGTEPPLGFRQFQAIDLSRWKGHGEPPTADRIRSAISRIADLPQTAPVPRPAANRRRLDSVFSRPLLAGSVIVAAVALLALALFLWQHWSSNQQIAIAVLPSSQSSDRTLAADYANVAAADMAAFLPRRFDRATVIGPADAKVPRSLYRMEISTDPHDAGVNATLTLSDVDGDATLWSQNWSVADASAADLKAEVSAAASKAALCLTEARGGSERLSQPALGLYLSGCAGLGGTKLSNSDFEAIFERVTKLAPDFPPGWDYLALSRSWIAQSLEESSPAAHTAAVKSARDAIVVARKLNPNSAMSYDAEFHLISNDTFPALEVLNKGAKIDPDDGRIQMHLSEGFLSVGRMSDSVQAAQRGVELEPASPYTRSQYILALVYAGEFTKAKADIAEARKKWPSDPEIDFADFRLQFRYGDPRAALELLPRITDSSDAEMAPYRKLIAARLDPTPANIDDAIAAFNSRASNNPRLRNDVLLALGNFGRVDAVYQLLEDPAFQPFIERQALFRPEFVAVRRDPLFMRVAARLGLVRYWRQTGFWPDFCTNEQLRYDCKAEAAKYRN